MYHDTAYKKDGEKIRIYHANSNGMYWVEQGGTLLRPNGKKVSSMLHDNAEFRTIMEALSFCYKVANNDTPDPELYKAELRLYGWED